MTDKEIEVIIKPIFTKMFNEKFSACDYGIECFKKGTEYQGIKELAIENDNLIKRNTDLEQKLEQTEKDLSDYQFNYPAIKELQKENAELKAKYLQATDEGTSWAHLKMLERQLAQAIDLIKNIIRVTWDAGWNYSLDWKVDTNRFLKEIVPPKV